MPSSTGDRWRGTILSSRLKELGENLVAAGHVRFGATDWEDGAVDAAFAAAFASATGGAADAIDIDVAHSAKCSNSGKRRMPNYSPRAGVLGGTVSSCVVLSCTWVAVPDFPE